MDPKGKGMVVNDKEKESIFNEPRDGIENGHVTGRKVGDGASHVVLEQVRQADAQPSDHLSYLTKTPDGKILSTDL